jgi:heterodisulfide reductase subunit B
MSATLSSEISFFPGCSLASSSYEGKVPLDYLFSHLGKNLVELDEWNCCGSSSAHSIDLNVAHDLASRNLSLVPEGNSLMVACPNCLLRLKTAHSHIKQDEKLKVDYEKKWGVPFNGNLEIHHFYYYLDQIDLKTQFKSMETSLKGLVYAPYNGCMLSRPPLFKDNKSYYGLCEKLLSSFGAEPLRWRYSSQCCGTFLSATNPEIVTPMVNNIVDDATKAGADCIITACAMCQMNLELRCNLKQKIPVMHFSEIMAVALGLGKREQKSWFSRHLINPNPFLRFRDLTSHR